MRLALTEFVTLDGVSQGPGSSTEDTSDGFDRGGWLVPYIDEAFVRRASAWLDLADGLLLGRRTYEAFARDWPRITDPDDPFTERMNTLPKYVVSATIEDAGWEPTTVLRGDPAEAVGDLKARPGRELQIHGSARLGHALLAARLVDTVRLVVAPTVLGAGRRLLTHPSPAHGLRLVGQETTPRGLLMLEYEAAGDAPLAEYEGVAALGQGGGAPARRGTGRRRDGRAGACPAMSHETTQIIGLVATLYGIVGATSALLQARQMVRRGSSCDVSARFFATYAGGYAVWLVYGLSIGSVPLIVVDATGLLCGGLTLAVTLRLRGSLLAPSSWEHCP